MDTDGATGSARRIVVLGCGGAGKTRLASRIAEQIAAPVVCLDAVWQDHWGPADIPAFRRLVKAAHAGDAWVSDGNFAQVTFDIRLPRADLILWLDTPRPLCAWRAVRRLLRPGEPHRFGRLPQVLRFIWAFDQVNRPRIEALRETHAPRTPVVHLKSGADVDAFVAGLR